MKRYSKEWWLNIATTVIRDFELCNFDNGIPHITFRQTYDWDDEDSDDCISSKIAGFANASKDHSPDWFVSKGYNYKEKSWEDFTEEFDEVGKAQKIVGRLEERERILGIIEKEMNNKVLDYEKELNWIEDEYDSSTDDADVIASEKKCAELDGQIKLSKLLIEKIKG